MKVRISKVSALWVGVLAGQSANALQLNIDDPSRLALVADVRRAN
jgi:hypothetical protein